jgi:hypothetical protein
VLALIMPSGNDAEVEKALADLGVQPGRTEYVFRPPSHLEPGSVDPYAIQVTPRSMLDVLNLAARTVAVPEKHIGIVPPLEPWPGHQTAEIRIRSSQNEPDFPYRVQHRDTWFYVDDSDLETRAFLEALVAAYASRLGSREAIDETPQVVLPVGG